MVKAIATNYRGIVRRIRWLAVALLLSSIVRAQEVAKVQPAAALHNALLAVPLGAARELKYSVRDFATFRDPQWSILTIAQIGAATADAVTSLNNLNHCLTCTETGTARVFVGQHPDAHKYIVAGIIEIGVEAVTAHYFRNRGPARKWYWRMIWSLPQSSSLFAHASASYQNAALKR
jgi:hypothetical protein